jgi:hypothetical protein
MSLALDVPYALATAHATCGPTVSPAQAASWRRASAERDIKWWCGAHAIAKAGYRSGNIDAMRAMQSIHVRIYQLRSRL